MRSLTEIIDNRIQSLIAAPVLARTDKAYISTTTGGYCIDATVLIPETLETTGELLKEVPLSPIWAGTDGRGIYAPPENGVVVVVGFVSNNKAWPFVIGPYGNQYAPSPDAKASSLVICDGKGAKLVFSADGLITLANTAASLKVLLESTLDLIGSMQSEGVGNKGLPVFSTSLAAPQASAIKAQVASLFKE